jgi:hypothetical protein
MSDLLARIEKEGAEPFSMISAVVRAVKPGGSGQAVPTGRQASETPAATATGEAAEGQRRSCC